MGVANPNKYKGGRHHYDLRSGSKESYDRFKLENPTLEINYKKYEEIIRELNAEYSRRILQGTIVKLSYGLGTILIRKIRGRKTFTDENGTHILLKVNWEATNKANAELKEGEEKVRIFHFNDNTEGFSCNWKWVKENARIKCSQIWTFKPCKKNQILLKEYIEKDPESYQKYIDFSK